MRILISDDSQISRHLLRATLMKWGYEVVVTTDGTEALEALRGEAPPPLAILDVDMPGMSGHEVCRKIRETPCAAPPYLILLTANNSKADAVAGLEAGADDFITKPFDQGELRARLGAGLRITELQGNLAKHLLLLQKTFAQLQHNSARLAQANENLVKEITARARAEEELRLQKLLLESQSEASIDGILVVTPDRKIISFNQRFIEIWGLSEALLASREEGPILQTILAMVRNPEEFSARIEHLYEHPDETSQEEIFLRNGRVLDTYGAPVKSGEGVYYGRVWFFRDITERNRAGEALRESEERYRLLFESSPHPMWVFDSETFAFLAVNDATVSHYGYSREEFLAMRIEEIRPAGDVPLLKSDLADAALAPHTNQVWKHQKKDGSIIDVETSSHPLTFDGKEARLVLANDITERLNLEAQLRQAQKLESIGQLAAGIAHEINTPTQYVGDNTRFLQDSFQDLSQVIEAQGRLLDACRRGAPPPELIREVEALVAACDLEYIMSEAPKAIRQSLEGSERISEIVQSMKEFAHPGTGEKCAADLNRAIESTLTVARNEWKYVAELVTDFDQTLPPVPCFLGEFNQVILNMTVNAAHAIAEANGESCRKGTIKVSTRHRDLWAEVSIIDTGCGIPEHLMPRIFDPFFTTKGVGRGTGQGLAISHAVVEKHGGSIEVESARGQGTKFLIRLPLD